VNRNFHFGFPTLIQRTPNRHPLFLRAAFFFREPFSTLADRVVALRTKSKIANARVFNGFHKHLSGPHALVTLISLCLSPPSTPPAPNDFSTIPIIAGWCPVLPSARMTVSGDRGPLGRLSGKYSPNGERQLVWIATRRRIHSDH
jgi:hypothetical protein